MATKKRLGSTYISVLSLALLLFLLVPTATVAAQDEGDTPGVGCNPAVQYLANEMGVECAVLLDQMANGIGLGELAHAWYLSQNLPDFAGDWQSLLQSKLSGEGWGQITRAYQLAASIGLPVEEVLALRDEGLGWGQLMQASALTLNLDVSLQEVVAMMQSGMNWRDIADQFGLPPGPPPWAGGRGLGNAFGNRSQGNGNAPQD